MAAISPVRLAMPADEPELIALLRMMHREGGMRGLDIDCVKATFAKAFTRRGGILAVIGDSGQIKGALFLLISRMWYTSENHLEDLFLFVHPDHRRSDCARQLVEYAKKCSDDISREMGAKVPLLMGVFSAKRTAAKVHLYRRWLGFPVGAVFVHNATWIDAAQSCDEDYWRSPKVALKIINQQRRVARRRIAAR